MTRRLLIFQCLILLPFAAFAQQMYKVTADTLEIRSGASSASERVGTVSKGGSLCVHEIKNGWARFEFDGGYAYVPSQGLAFKGESAGWVRLPMLEDIYLNAPRKTAEGFKWMAVAVLAAGIAMFVVRRRFNANVAVATYKRFVTAFVALTALELIYMFLEGSGTMWFVVPDSVGWIAAIIGAILMFFVLYVQIKSGIDLFYAFREYTGTGFNLSLGLYSWLGMLGGGILSAFVGEWLSIVVLVAFVACQLIQIYRIFRETKDASGTKQGVLGVGIYVLGTLATALFALRALMVALATVMYIIAFVLIASIFLTLLFGARKASSRNGTTRY